MRVEHYIEELLYRYHCVVVPGFGAFLTQTKSAEIHPESNTLYPPSKVVSFNEQLSKNDGLLVSYVADANNMSYEEMLEEVSLIVKDWKKRLQSGDSLELFKVGKLWRNTEGKILFEPENKINYLTSSFGLSSFVASPVHHVIAGAFRVRKNADKKIAALKRKGYNAVHVGTNKFGLHQVAYASFEDSEEALEFLKKVRRSESADAWLLSKK